MSALNLTPNSTELSGPPSIKAGTVELGQMLRFAGTVTVMLKAWVLVPAGLAESVTLMLKLKMPDAVGVPLITPVAGFNTRPAGSAPLTIDHE